MKTINEYKELLDEEVDEDRMDLAEAGFLLGYEKDAKQTIEGDA